ncbi:hypothetical protein QM334_37055, partial [Burkholderia cenocepacia]|nr:hypothetical protein [Burkholderia cenocepacia]
VVVQRRRARTEAFAMQPAQPIPTLARIALAVDPTPESLTAARYVRTLLSPGMRLRIICAIACRGSAAYARSARRSAIRAS